MQTMYTLAELRNEPQTHDKTQGTWQLAKPENVKPGSPGWILWRIKAAWHVLRGRAVPVLWL